jgi:hypothetical protein
MLSMTLNVLLLLLSAAATLAAFGGDTWTKGSEPLLKRVTARGWFSLICLVLTLIVGAGKEIRSSRQETSLQRERDEANVRLVAANDKLESLDKNLNATTALLARQLDINLITALSSHSPVTEGALWLEFAPSISNKSDSITLLTSEDFAMYREVVRVQLDFTPFLGLNSHLTLRYDGDAVRQFSQIPNSDLPTINSNTRDVDPIYQFILTQHTDPNSKDRSAAIAYRDLNEEPEVAQIEIIFLQTFADEDSMKNFLRAHTSLQPVETKQDRWSKDQRYIVYFAIPQPMISRMKAYWTDKLRSAHLHLYLDSEAYLMISLDALSTKIVESPSSLAVHLRSKGKPYIEVGIRPF